MVCLILHPRKKQAEKIEKVITVKLSSGKAEGARDVILDQGKMCVFSRCYFVHEGIWQFLETYLDIPTGGEKSRGCY